MLDAYKGSFWNLVVGERSLLLSWCDVLNVRLKQLLSGICSDNVDSLEYYHARPSTFHKLRNLVSTMIEERRLIVHILFVTTESKAIVFIPNDEFCATPLAGQCGRMRDDVIETRKKKRRSNKQNLKVQTSHKAVMVKSHIPPHQRNSGFLMIFHMPSLFLDSNFTKVQRC